MLCAGILQLLRNRVRPALRIFCFSLFWLWICAMPYFSGTLIGLLENDYPPIAARKLPNADVIVLLGGAIRGKASEETLADMSGLGDRVLFAVTAFNASKAPLILVTGGAPEGDDSEAMQIREILVALGVPHDKIVLETRNRDTLDNRLYMPEKLRSIGAESVLLVTSAFHMRRALWVFEPLDVNVYAAPTDHQVLPGGDDAPSPLSFLPSVKALQLTTWAFHEGIGYLYYSFQD